MKTLLDVLGEPSSPGAVGVTGRNIAERIKVFKFFRQRFPVRLDVEVSPFFGAGCDLRCVFIGPPVLVVGASGRPHRVGLGSSGQRSPMVLVLSLSPP